MLRDVKSSMLIAECIASDNYTVAATEGASVDHSLGNSASFFIDAGTFGSGALLDVKLQYSDDNSAWTDEDGLSGNDTATAQLSASGDAQLNVVNPQGRYSRVLATNTVEAVNYCVTSIMGPLRSITPTDL